MNLKAVVLEGEVVTLEPVTAAMETAMREALSVDPESWALQYRCGHGDQFPSYWSAMVAGPPSRISFAVRLRATGRLVGTSSYIDLSPENRTLEIGSTFLRPEVRGTAVNPEMKLLLLREAFDQGALRVQFTADTRNVRSCAALATIGAVREGVLRNHRVTWTGHLRDSVVFSITRSDWPAIRGKLHDRCRNRARRPVPVAEGGRAVRR